MPKELTKSHILILKELEKGLSNQQIADNLNISKNTVKAQLFRIFKRLGANNRTHAVMIARDKGLI